MPVKASSGASEPSLILYQLVCIQTYTVYIIIVVILTIMIYYYYDLLLLWFIIIIIIILVNTSSTWVMLQLPIHHEPYLTSQLISIMVDIHMFPGGVNQPEQKPRCLSQITFIHRLFWMNPIKTWLCLKPGELPQSFNGLRPNVYNFLMAFLSFFQLKLPRLMGTDTIQWHPRISATPPSLDPNSSVKASSHNGYKLLLADD